MTQMTFQIEYIKELDVFFLQVIQAPIGVWGRFWTEAIQAGKKERAAVLLANKEMRMVMFQVFGRTPVFDDLKQNYPGEAVSIKSTWTSVQRTGDDLRTHNAAVAIKFNDPRLTTKFKLSWGSQEVVGTMPSEAI